MRRAVMIASLALTSYALAARAQAAPAAPAGIKLSDVAGTWTVKSMVGPKDSVVITTTVTQTADGKGATMQFAVWVTVVVITTLSLGPTMLFTVQVPATSDSLMPAGAAGAAWAPAARA